MIRAVYPFVLLVALWWALAGWGVLGNEFVMPPPGRVLDHALHDGALASEALTTLHRVAVAYALAVAAGVVVGTLIGCVRPVRLALRPVVSFLCSASKIAFGFAEAVFPVLLATAAGTSRVEPQLVWPAAALGTPRRATLHRVVLPAALPAILTGARIGLVGAVIGVFVGEMIAAADGLGHMMAVAYRTLDTPAMYVAIVATSLLGYVLDRSFLLARRRLLRWT